MASFNKVILMGNLTRDPQLKYLPSGTPVCEFGVATNRKWTDQASGQMREQTMFVDCQVMGKTAETVSRNFTKGKPILIEGRLDYRQWTTPAGEKRSKHEVFVESFSFVGSAGGGAGGDGGEGRPRFNAAPRTAQPAAAQDEYAESSAPPSEDVPF
ncbi:MAG TPA: single-stranded DNA-binding protein [Planctomycetota bacterium]|nr:single-stranded DNA-binding protein [Planctomycetota bacterium]